MGRGPSEECRRMGRHWEDGPTESVESTPAIKPLNKLLTTAPEPTHMRPSEILDRYNFTLSIGRDGRFGTLTLSQTKRTPINMSTSMYINISLPRAHTVDCSLGYFVSGKKTQPKRQQKLANAHN